MLWRGAYTVSWSISSVSTMRHISTSCCQSRLFRAKRETSRAATAPTVPRQTSATMRSKPRRATAPAADRPRSAPTTSIRQTPNACSRPVMAYCRAPLSRLCMTWWGEDCRTSSIALRRRCCGPIVADIITARPRIAGIVHVVQHQPNHQLARLPACSARTRALSRRVLRNAALRPSEQIELIRSVPALAVHPVSISHGSLPDPSHRRPILRTSREPYTAHPTRTMPETIAWRDPPGHAPQRASPRRPRGRTSTAELPARGPVQLRRERIARERCPPSLRHYRPAQAGRPTDAFDKVPCGCRAYGRSRARLYNAERPHSALGGTGCLWRCGQAAKRLAHISTGAAATTRRSIQKDTGGLNHNRKTP